MPPSSSTDSLSDADVISRSVDTPDLFALIFDRHVVAVRSYLQGRVGIAEADGLVVDAFAAAFAARTKYDDRHGNALPWVMGFARNMARNELRSGRRLSRLRSRLRGTERAEAPVDSSDRLDAERVGGRVRLAVRALPVDQQEVLLLYALAGLSYEEIADSLGVPVGTVRSRLARGRQRLRAVLADLSPEENWI